MNIILILLIHYVISMKQEKIIYISTITSEEKRLYIRDEYHFTFPLATLQSPISLWYVSDHLDENENCKLEGEDEIGKLYSHYEKINNQMFKTMYSYGTFKGTSKSKNNEYDNQISFALNPHNKSHSLTHLFYQSNEIDHLMFGISSLDSNNYQFFCFGSVPPHIAYSNQHGSCSVTGDTWGCELKSIYYSDLYHTMYKSNHTYRAIFEHLEQDILIPKDYFEFIKETFFKDLLQRKVCQLEYKDTAIWCDSESDFNVFPNFTIFEFDGITLSLYRRDFIYNHKWFIIRKTDESKYKPNEWVFGYRFMKRYHMFFDYETRKITFYLNAALKARVISNSNGSNETKVQICFALFNILCLGLTILVISNHSIQYIC